LEKAIKQASGKTNGGPAKPDVFDLALYRYDLPESAIAQDPAEPRDASKLLVLDVRNRGVSHQIFRDLPDFLNPGDLLVLNDTRVIPARLLGRKRTSGTPCEIFLLEPVQDDCMRWRALVRPGRRLPAGTVVDVADRAFVIGETEDEGIRLVSMMGSQDPGGREEFMAFLRLVGHMPLPPYIKRSKAPPEAYQPLFARRDGSVAAPTASLHFTETLLRRLEERKVERAWVTLHVGLGTFRPVQAADIREHKMHRELCVMPEATADAIEACRARGGRVFAAGTTVARTLECFADGGRLVHGTKRTDLFLYPGSAFRIVDGLITNFHLPESTLLMLVSAFIAHRRRIAADALSPAESRIQDKMAVNDLLDIYQMALRENYRFFSFGDAMLIL
jgi:S-adenosylmethionine:tRNA ribosyltransferase-isomerase